MDFNEQDYAFRRDIEEVFNKYGMSITTFDLSCSKNVDFIHTIGELTSVPASTSMEINFSAGAVLNNEHALWSGLYPKTKKIERGFGRWY